MRALTWRRLRGVQRGGARLQGQTEARAGQSQLAQQDPHAAEHIPLTARALTHSVSRCGGADRERARGGTRWRTDGALLRPPPPRLVAISRRLTSRRRRHGCDVINGTSHGPPAAASPRRPPEPALTAPLVRAGAFIRPRRPRPTATSFLPHSVRAFHGQTRASTCLTSTITMANIRHSTNTILSRGKIFTIQCIVDDVLPL